MLRITGFLLKKQDFKEDSDVNLQSGSAIIWIFLMIALFAALNYAISRGSRTGGDQISEERARLAANEIVDYGRALKETVQALQINGCTDSEISFEQPTVAGYTNANSPTDNSCHVFHVNGGGMRLTQIPDSIQTTSAGNTYPKFSGSTAFSNEGSAGSELYLHARSRSQKTCTAYNDKLGIANIANDAPEEDGIQTTPLFIGAYSSGTTFGDDGDGANFSSFQTGCYKDANETDTDGTPFYDFYQILIVR